MRYLIGATKLSVVALALYGLSQITSGLTSAGALLLALFVAAVAIAVLLVEILDAIPRLRRIGERQPFTRRRGTCAHCGHGLTRVEEIWICLLCDGAVDIAKS